MTVNVSQPVQTSFQISKFLSLIGEPRRIQILLVISAQEACVCHLEAVLGLRQAVISQHLMILRKAGLVSASREGRNIFYRLDRPEVADLLYQAADCLGISPEPFQQLTGTKIAGCPCPRCNHGLSPKLACQSFHQSLDPTSRKAEPYPEQAPIVPSRNPLEEKENGR